MQTTTDMKCIGCATMARGERSTLKIEQHDTNWIRAPKGWWITPMSVPGGVTLLAVCEVCMKIGRWKPPDTVVKPAEAVATPDE